MIMSPREIMSLMCTQMNWEGKVINWQDCIVTVTSLRKFVIRHWQLRWDQMIMMIMRMIVNVSVSVVMSYSLHSMVLLLIVVCC